MLPVVKITGGTVQNLLLYVSVIGLLLVISTIIRLKVPLLRKAFIPASLLAGIIGLILGPHVLKIIPPEITASMGALPGQMIVIVFACMLLGIKKTNDGATLTHNAISGLAWLWMSSFLQVGVVCLLCAFLFIPAFGVDPMFGSVFEIGFAGGHGTAGGMAQVFKQLGWADGGDVGKTTATIGLMAGIIGGMIMINYGVRKAAKIYVDNWEMIKHRMISTVALMWKDGLIKDEDITGSLGAVLKGKVKARENDEEIIYYNAVGMGILDLAVCARAYKKALAEGKGTKVPYWL